MEASLSVPSSSWSAEEEEREREGAAEAMVVVGGGLGVRVESNRVPDTADRTRPDCVRGVALAGRRSGCIAFVFFSRAERLPFGVRCPADAWVRVERHWTQLGACRVRPRISQNQVTAEVPTKRNEAILKRKRKTEGKRDVVGKE